ncbi:hypothetical protein [Marinilactibacillus sp. Marseille-P9653]|uniref:hypothetical protein n=1 Tax=Marinilactibacillus sp. Marseille-P9653 TaxID=2866583 RepID=UPI001CE3E6E1|nr:hypothetical protein [Marinilactibacillus sp. Marseille-P9653]
MSQHEIDSKTLVWYPLFSFILFLILYLFFNIPFWTFFIVLFAVILYYALFIYIEIKRKD